MVISIQTLSSLDSFPVHHEIYTTYTISFDRLSCYLLGLYCSCISFLLWRKNYWSIMQYPSYSDSKPISRRRRNTTSLANTDRDMLIDRDMWPWVKSGQPVIYLSYHSVSMQRVGDNTVAQSRLQSRHPQRHLLCPRMSKSLHCYIP